MKKMKRIVSMILACALVLPMAVIHADATSENTQWLNVREDNALSLHGLYMDKESDVFPRMDLDVAVAKNINARVEQHARVSAGGRIRFSTDSSYIKINAEFPNYLEYSGSGTVDEDMGNGKYGFDIYVDTAEGSTYMTTIAPDSTELPDDYTEESWSYEGSYEFGTAEERNITIYFPTLQEVSEVSVGVQDTAIVEAHKIPYDDAAPIVYYGSSITQGASATRPGLTYVNTIGRSINRDYINLGMFGGCKAETAFAEYIAGLDMSIFVFDHDHNCDTPEELANGSNTKCKGHEAFYKVVREEHPDIPIIFISRPGQTKNVDWEAMREVIKKTYHNAIANGDQNVYFIDGQSFFNGEEKYLEDDGVHPTDEGQAAMADTIGNVLKGIIDGNKSDDSYWFTDDFSYTAEEFANSGWTNKNQLNIDEQRGVLQVGTDSRADNTYTYLDGNTNVSKTWNDFTFEADVKITNTAFGDAGTVSAFLLFGGEEDNDESAYQFMLRTDNQVRLLDRKHSKDNRAFSDTRNTNVTASIGNTYNMKVVTSGNTITCYLDDVKVFEVTPELDETNPYAGRIGIRAAKNLVEVDNVRVYANRDEVLYEEGFDYEDGTSVADADWTHPTRNSIKNGKLNVGLGSKSAPNVYTYLAKSLIDETVTNYTVEADVTVTDTNPSGSTGTASAALIVGASDDNTNTKDGYQLLISGFDKENGGEVILKDFFGEENDMFSQIEKDGYTFNIGDTYNLKIVVNNKTIRCYVDDQLAIKYTCVTDEANPFAGRIGIRSTLNVVEVDNVLIRSAAQFDDSYYNVSYYRNGLDEVTHPYKEGKVFAGWYEDAEYRTPYSKAKTTGYAYAKFVDENVLSMKAQITKGTNAESETTDLRLVTTVDSLNYSKIGFDILVPDEETEYYDCGKVMYSTVKGFVDGNETAYQPTVFSNDSYRFATCYFIGQLQSTFNSDITVTPTWVTLDGTTVSGVQRTFKISDGFSH